MSLPCKNHDFGCKHLVTACGSICTHCDAMDPSGMIDAGRAAQRVAEKRRGDENDSSNMGFQTYVRNGVKGKFWSAGRRRSLESDDREDGIGGAGGSSSNPCVGGTKTWRRADGRLYSQ
ncbi:hypothetical protein DOTSEDRAFT_74699 [Dothistroma septosporum NZE10]|uniref:Uncharacterized protein n=1 Tax=Dothistroma septosporum (strain NZE10 / CBS 128990) TaxID=675120 RepID=N1PCW7_DOTSN|nr:hypothetical protein DOTSEDRAFT_74699 [Dothistroma septosporum NZE10]